MTWGYRKNTTTRGFMKTGISNLIDTSTLQYTSSLNCNSSTKIVLSLNWDFSSLLRVKKEQISARCLQPLQFHTFKYETLRKTRNTIFCGFYANLTFPLPAPQSQVLCWPQVPACVIAEVAAALLHWAFIICYQQINTCQIQVTHMQALKLSCFVYHIYWKCMSITGSCSGIYLSLYRHIL